MSTKNKAATAGETAADMNLLELLLSQGAQEIRLDRSMYAAEKVGQVPLAGYIVDLLDMPPIDQGKGKPARDWQAFVFLVTYPTKGIDREDNVVDVTPGEEIIIPATFQIQHALARFAKDEKKMHEIALQPKAKVDIGGGKSFWTSRVVATGKEKERGAVYALTSVPTAIAELPEPSGTFDPATGEVRENAKVAQA